MFVHDTPVQAQLADALALVERPQPRLSQAHQNKKPTSLPAQ
jgi:hypothetical protein